MQDTNERQRAATFTKTEPMKAAFLLDEDKLRNLVAAVEKDLGISTGWTFVVSFSDDTSEIFTSVDEVTSLRNSSARYITGMLIATPQSNSTTVVITLSSVGNTPELTPIEAQIAGPAETVLNTHRNLKDYIVSLGQWYTPVVYHAQTGIGLLLMILLYVSFFILGAYFGSYLFPEDSSMLRYIVTLVILLVLGAVLGTVGTKLLSKLISKYFPVGVFAIGDGIERYESIKKTRKAVIGLVTGGPISALLVGLLTAWLT